MKTGRWAMAAAATCTMLLGACGGKTVVVGVVNTSDQSVAVTIAAGEGESTTLEVAPGSSASLSRNDLDGLGVGSVTDGVTMTVEPEAGQTMSIRLDPPPPYHLRVTGAGGQFRLVRDTPKRVDPLGGANPEYDPRRDNPGFTGGDRR